MLTTHEGVLRLEALFKETSLTEKQQMELDFLKRVSRVPEGTLNTLGNLKGQKAEKKVLRVRGEIT